MSIMSRRRTDAKKKLAAQPKVVLPTAETKVSDGDVAKKAAPKSHKPKGN